MKKLSVQKIVTIAVLTVIVAACRGVASTDPLTAEFTDFTPSPTTTHKISSRLAASSIQELAYYSDIVAVGRVTSQDQIINTARDPGDPTKPDPRFFSINQVYTVEVESILKGDPLKTLLVVQHQGRLSTHDGTKPALAEIEGEISRNEQKTFIPLSEDTRYIFFLRVLDTLSYDLDGYNSTGLYAGVLEPWRFMITSDELVIPETLLPQADQCFPPKTFDDITAKIEAAGQTYTPGERNPCTEPYPSPATDAPAVPGGQTPYP